MFYVVSKVDALLIEKLRQKISRPDQGIKDIFLLSRNKNIC